jgi:septum site-determining protein MinC
MPREEPAFKIKNANLGLFVLHLATTDMARITAQLEKRLGRTPKFFADSPVALGLEAIAQAGAVPDFSDLVAYMRGHGMCAAGVLGGSPEQRAAAVQAGLGLFPEAPPRPGPRSERAPEPAEAPAEPAGAPAVSGEDPVQPELAGLESPQERAAPRTVPQGGAPEPEAPQAPPRPTLLIEKPVRTGQRIHAEGADLVVLATVSPGAELIADGDIHVYATLRGRALAGARGNRQARIFVQGMEAELVSIAGYFQVFEEGIPDALRGRPVQVRLDGERVVVAPLAQKR